MATTRRKCDHDERCVIVSATKLNAVATITISTAINTRPPTLAPVPASRRDDVTAHVHTQHLPKQR
jgi:hypothetical protein